MEKKIFTPADVICKRSDYIPDFVFRAFNSLLVEKYRPEETIITQNEAIARILAYAPDEDLNRHIIFEKHWLDIEDSYRKNGWDVEYDKPGYNENYQASFKFKPKQQ